MVVTQPKEGADVEGGCPLGDRLSRGTKAREGSEVIKTFHLMYPR